MTSLVGRIDFIREAVAGEQSRMKEIRVIFAWRVVLSSD